MNGKHNEISLLVDQSREDKYESFSFQLFPEQQDCIQNGDVEGLEACLEKESVEYYRQTDPKEEELPYLLPYLCGCVLMAACGGGLPLERGAAISSKYLALAPSVTSVDRLVETAREMKREFAREVHLHKRFNSGHQGVNTCMRYIYEHVGERLTVGQLAEVCGYSPSRLQHLFRVHTGVALTAYIRREKMERACLLLKHTDLSCAAIGQKLSFCSQSHFTQRFREEMGMTPAEYRSADL